MQSLEKMLYEQQKLLVLNTAENSHARLNHAYVYAWENDIYPFLHKRLTYHKAYDGLFQVNSQQMDELVVILFRNMDSNVYMTFWELEDYFKYIDKGRDRWRRVSLITTCRYIFLCAEYPEDWVKVLLTPNKFPLEAGVIGQR